jgi:hypothetical protein
LGFGIVGFRKFKCDEIYGRVGIGEKVNGLDCDEIGIFF